MCIIKITSEYIEQKGGIEAYLDAQQHIGSLRFLTCGSVDDGKSTLIGRLLHDSSQICDDQLLTLRNDSKKYFGHSSNKLNLALLVDGLQDEREQGITIDVAYRYFSTQKRRFIIADAPGHEQYTRNMVTGASTSDLAILLIDARKGVREQTKRHSFICILLGIRYFIIVVNKMDLVDFSDNIFKKIQEDYLIFISKFVVDVKNYFIPLSALNGDNIIMRSRNMSWYDGKTLLDILENVDVMDLKDKLEVSHVLRFPVQYIIKHADLDFRGYAGTVASGKIQVGQLVKIFPSGIISKIDRIVTFNGDCQEAYVGESITLVLADDIDISRGDLIVDVNEELNIVYSAQVDIVWMSETELLVGQIFTIKVAGKKNRARVENIQYRINVSTFDRCITDSLSLNSIGLVDLVFDEPLMLDKYLDNRITGSFILIDTLSNNTVGAGMVRELSTKNCGKKNDVHADFELALNSLICRYYPHWGVRNLLKGK
ncbi:sulfate adenylyltransferase subunit CysN [Blochmannia endosymbiont of Colobopsis nipponica]|uniref:sulfate adenylyltransferase subunit CysN n=1 Tax=Blochmannia endosymbiont of Colobopsis nipponica TaxID=2681987 RepID=UPI001783E4D4|nr:sulfate adenylyltransferase subunit CysN [Blochmannia endosymbiont of Colobopsis nipponica]QOI11244.1 sulfate adenylyltransferase subunit CysN [Blochmannia endosymbiont of Colobopsis nipponica]